MSEFDRLVQAAQAEREQVLSEIAVLDAKKAEAQDRLKRYDRVINAANPGEKKPPAPKGPKKQDWRVSSGMIEQVYAAMRAESARDGNGEFTPIQIAKLTGVSEATIHKTVQILHEEGRIRLVRKHRQQRYWGVVT
jgi:ribosomal protein S25